MGTEMQIMKDTNDRLQQQQLINVFVFLTTDLVPGYIFGGLKLCNSSSFSSETFQLKCKHLP